MNFKTGGNVHVFLNSGQKARPRINLVRNEILNKSRKTVKFDREIKTILHDNFLLNFPDRELKD